MQLCYIIVARAAARIKRSGERRGARGSDFLESVHVEFFHLTDFGGNYSIAITTFKSIKANVLKVHLFAAFVIPGRQFRDNALLYR